MMKFLTLFVLVLLGVSCASQQKAAREVDKEAKAVEPVTNPRSQYARAISMIRANTELKDEQKDRLVGVMNTYAMKAMETRMKQSQYRAVLVSEMLNSGTKKNPKVDVARRNLQKMENENSKDLGKFIRDFKYYAGKTPMQNFQPAMVEMLRIQ